MAACRCRDTGSKRCRWLFSTPEPFSATFHDEVVSDRLATRRALAQVDIHDAEGVLV